MFLFQSVDLTQHKLIYDGTLTMKLGDTKRVKALHVLLLEDCMMLLQKQVNLANSSFTSIFRKKTTPYDLKM